MHRTITMYFIGVLTALLAFSGCHDKSGQAVPLSFAGERYDPDAIHLALLADHDCLPLLYAKRSGLFDSLGLKVQVVVYRSQADVDTALLGKLCDGGRADLIRLNSHKRRADDFQAMWQSTVLRRLFVCGDLRIKDIQDLKGRTVAFPRISAEAQAFTQMLRASKLSRNEVYCPQIGDLPLRVTMLTDGQFDATLLTWPYTVWAEAAGNRCIYTPKVGDTNSRFVMRRKWLADKRHQAQWERLEQIRHMAIDSLRIKGPKAYKQILQRDYGLPAEIADTLRWRPS